METPSKRVDIDVLYDCAYAGQAPSCFASDDDDLESADQRFIELVAPYYRAAGERLGYEVVLTSDQREIDQICQEWDDQLAYHQAWQRIHDNVAVDLGALARQALQEVRAYRP